MSTIERPAATYSLTVQVQIEGITAPLAITADSVNEIKKAVRLLHANGLPRSLHTPTSVSAHAGAASRRWYGATRMGNATRTTLLTDIRPTYRAFGRAQTLPNGRNGTQHRKQWATIVVSHTHPGGLHHDN
jgi:hypothetical protein